MTAIIYVSIFQLKKTIISNLMPREVFRIFATLNLNGEDKLRLITKTIIFTTLIKEGD